MWGQTVYDFYLLKYLPIFKYKWTRLILKSNATNILFPISFTMTPSPNQGVGFCLKLLKFPCTYVLPALKSP